MAKKKTKKSEASLPKIKKKSSKKTAKKTTKKKTSSRNPKDDKDIAMEFAAEVHKHLSTLIKATVLFGSQAKNKPTPGSDIDVIIIVDDAGIAWDSELIEWYRKELGKIISANSHSDRLHVNTVKLTTWWNDLMHGDPVVLNILRYGETLIDIGGFFKPLKALLLQGKIHSTPEAVYAALQRAPMHLARSHVAQMGSIEGIYWTMVDAAQAALITLGKLPPSPEHLAGLLKEHFVDQGLLKIEYVRWYKQIFDLHKAIAHGQGRHIKGIEIDEWQERAEQFLRRMTEIIDKLVESSKKE